MKATFPEGSLYMGAKEEVKRFSPLKMLVPEVEVAVREVKTSYSEIQSTLDAMRATQSEVDYLFGRWKHFGGEEQAASLLLQDLLDAQERLSAAEYAFAQAQVGYTVALYALKQATGTLLEYEQISPARAWEDGVPRLMLEKPQEG